MAVNRCHSGGFPISLGLNLPNADCIRNQTVEHGGKVSKTQPFPPYKERVVGREWSSDLRAESNMRAFSYQLPAEDSKDRAAFPRLKHRVGFTLIELLSSMTILVVLVLMMARVFTETTDLWQSSERRIMAATEGRVIMDFLVREFSLAIADDVVAFRVNSFAGDVLHSVSAYGAESDEVAFVAMTRPGTPDGEFRRTANQFYYFVTHMRDENDEIIENRYRLARQRLTRAMYLTVPNRATSAYTFPPTPTSTPFAWWEEVTGGDDLRFVETVAENVAAFELWAYGVDGGGGPISIPNYDSRDNFNRLPLYVDIYLEMLGEQEAIQAAALWASDEQGAREFVDRRAQRFTARVQFPNRDRAFAFEE